MYAFTPERISKQLWSGNIVASKVASLIISDLCHGNHAAQNCAASDVGDVWLLTVLSFVPVSRKSAVCWRPCGATLHWAFSWEDLGKFPLLDCALLWRELSSLSGNSSDNSRCRITRSCEAKHVEIWRSGLPGRAKSQSLQEFKHLEISSLDGNGNQFTLHWTTRRQLHDWVDGRFVAARCPENRSQKNLLFVQPLNFMKNPDWPQNSWQRTIFSVVLQALPCWNGIYMLSKQLESMLRKLQRIGCLTVTQQSGRISEDRSTEKMWQWATVFGLGKLSPVGMMKFATPRVGNSDPTALAWDTTHNWFGERHWELAVA